MEEKKQTPVSIKKPSAWKSFLGKKWAFPALYIGAAAIILAIVMWYQGTATDQTVDKDDLIGVTDTTSQHTHMEADETEGDAIPVSNTAQPFVWPVAKEAEYKVGMNYFDESASDDAKAQAMVQYDQTFYPHKGIDLVAKDGKTPFDVVAALPGKVKYAGVDPLMGNVVEIEHANNVVTVYQSLDKTFVKAGDTVQQNQVIGVAGRSEMEKNTGVHLHFEVLVDGNNENPAKYLPQSEQQ
jgi:stage II sporulation protein Q